jgi:hypothetical protein
MGLPGYVQAQSKKADHEKLTPAVKIDRDDIGGIVTGPNGREAGVWVIAETRDLPTKFAKIVVTDDQGRYVIPDLPNGTYDVWVRGYGLVDSQKVKARPGRMVDLKAVPAPSEKDAAAYYPSMYWFSLIRVPQESEFPIGPMANQMTWVSTIKQGSCQSCHAIGTPGTRNVPELFKKGGEVNSVDAWRERLKSGSAMALMARDSSRLGERGLQDFAKWTDDIAKGELPFAKPERPKGVERNLVVTTWDWSEPKHYLHDLVLTDRRNPRVNANGRAYGSPEDSTDLVPWVDPKTHSAGTVMHPVRDPKTPSTKDNPHGPSAYWGADPIWDGKTLNHNPMMDERGRVWFTSRITPDANPDFCKSGSEHPSAKAFPLNGGANRHLSNYDPKSGKWTLIRTCFPTHHLNFASDKDQTLWTSPGVVGPGVIGWLNRRVYEQTGDEVRAQGWTPFVLDTNGNGRRDEYVEPDAALDASKDKRIQVNMYAVAVSPSDGAVWGTILGAPGGIARVIPGADPVKTALTEYYEVPMPGYSPRGGDVDSNGVYWVSLASGHLGQFDRRKCKVTAGPSATGKHCPEGWTLHQYPGPQLRDVKTPGSAEISYYTWVDRFGIFGLGKNVPVSMGNGSDAVYAFVDGQMLTLHIPYPMGVFPKNVDGRIDDPKTGWKGRGIWTTSGTRVLFHSESGKEGNHKAVKLQLRPSPLAR